MAGYVFKNAKRRTAFAFSLLGLGFYKYLIWTYLYVCYIHISNSKIERESKIKRQNKKQNI